MATASKRLCLAGGVALNVKMNSRLRQSGLFDDIFVFPIPSDPAPPSAPPWAFTTSSRASGRNRSSTSISALRSPTRTSSCSSSCGLAYRVRDDIADATAELLEPRQGGRLVPAWRRDRGRWRAIDPGRPRLVDSRDRVNAAIKFREYWRPFCPSCDGAAVHARRHAGSLHDHGVRGHRARLEGVPRRSFTSMAPCACRR